MSEIYFSHDANAADDEKIQAMLYGHGAAGYGLYWIIVERMRRAENSGYALKLKPYIFVAIARIAGVEPTDVEDFIHECVDKYELFCRDEEYVWSESLRRRMEIKDAKREQRGVHAKRAAEKRWNNDGNTQAQDNDAPRNADAMPEHAQRMPEHADSMPEHSDRNAKHAKAKGKGKDKELGSSARSDEHAEVPAVSKPPPMKDSLAQSWEGALTEIQPSSTWGNYGKERSQCKVLAQRTRELLTQTPYESPEEIIEAVLAEYRRMKAQSRADYWKSAAWTPSAVISRWSAIWEGIAKQHETREVLVF